MHILNLVSVLMLFSTIAYGKISYLGQIYTQANQLYSGSDHNSISYQITHFEENKFSEITSKPELMNTIKNCVFILEGAYGHHISDKKQAYISQVLFNSIAVAPKEPLRYFSINIPNYVSSEFEYFISAPCALILVDNQSNMLILQGVSYN